MKDDYIKFIEEHIELDKLLATTKPEYHNQIKELLKKKKEIIEKNGIFANFQLNQINKKIQKIKSKK
jgi:hypothetical protein